MTEQRQLLTGFFKHEVHEYILPDLLRLRREIRPDPDAKALRGCTIATTMFAFAVIDLFGCLMRPSAAIIKERDDTAANITHFLGDQAGLFPPEYKSNTEILIKLFRHGMTHQVLPKASGIAKITGGPTRGLIFYQPPGHPNLNADKLVDDLISAFRILHDKTHGDTELASLMASKIQFLRKEDDEQREKLRKRGLVEPEGPCYSSQTRRT